MVEENKAELYRLIRGSENIEYLNQARDDFFKAGSKECPRWVALWFVKWFGATPK